MSSEIDAIFTSFHWLLFGRVRISKRCGAAVDVRKAGSNPKI